MSLGAAATGAPRKRTPAEAAGAGAALRTILFDPRRGFSSAVRRRERSEGLLPTLLAAAGGAAVMLLWLKLGALAGRNSPEGSFRWGYLAASLALGAVTGVCAQQLWALIAARIAGASHAGLRIVWGLASLPHVVALLVLLPADAGIAGPAAFTTGRLSDSVATVWTALSIAAAVSLAVWSIYLFVVGLSAGPGLSGGRRLGAVGLALVSWVVVVGALAVVAVLVSRAA